MALSAGEGNHAKHGGGAQRHQSALSPSRKCETISLMPASDPHLLLRSLFDAAVAAADPALIVPDHLPEPPKGRTIVVGAGKAAAAMAAAVEKHWRGPLEGLVVTRVGHGAPTKRIRVVEAGHPNPDAAGMAAAGEILAMAHGLTSDDLVLALISGGGSALLSLPGGEVTLADKQAITRALLKSGARIGEMNIVRKHLSAIKGGRLAIAAAPARVVTLILSDVPGDDLSVIASGPTVADASTLADAREVLARYRIDVPPRVAAHLADPLNETPKPGDPRLARVENRLIATPRGSLLAAAAKAREAGYAPLILGDAIEGEARDRALSRAKRRADRCALRSSLRRRDDGDDPGQRPRRPQQRVRALACDRPRGARRNFRPRRRHRRHRRRRGQRRRGCHAGYADPRPGARPRRAGAPRRQRFLFRLRRPRRPYRHRPDAHQRRRLPCDSGWGAATGVAIKDMSATSFLGYSLAGNQSENEIRGQRSRPPRT
jgi:glycerate-2-kinase